MEDVFAFSLGDGLDLLARDIQFLECTYSGSLILCFVNEPSAFAVLAENGFNQTPSDSEMIMLEISYRPPRSIFFSEGMFVELDIDHLGAEFLNKHELKEVLLPEGSHVYVNYANSQYDPEIKTTSLEFLDVLRVLRANLSVSIQPASISAP